MISLQLIAFTLFASSLAIPTANKYEVFEEASVPKGWTLDASVPVASSSAIKLAIHMTQQNVAEFENKLIQMSTPGHASYGNHMSAREVKDFLAPHEETVKLVSDWLKSAGIAENATTVKNDWVFVDTNIGHAEKLLQTQYDAYTTTTGPKRTIFRTTEYSVPKNVKKHIQMIQPTTVFSTSKAKVIDAQKTMPIPAGGVQTADFNGTTATQAQWQKCSAAMTPACIRAMYNITGYTPVVGSNKMGINGYLEQYPQYDDLAKFSAKYQPKNNNFTCTLVHGGLCTQHPNVTSERDFEEANLDVQYATSLTYPIPVNYFSTGGRAPVYIPDESQGPDNYNEPYLDFLNYAMALNSSILPQVLSTSYGDDEQTIPRSYANSVCNLFAQLGARGVSVIFSSGDNGPGDTCLSNDGKNTTTFVPEFPASCPWVTTVGATIGASPERAVDFSSGGFSNYFGRPAYQNTTIATWITKYGGSQAKYYNASGRAYPGKITFRPHEYRS